MIFLICLIHYKFLNVVAVPVAADVWDPAAAPPISGGVDVTVPAPSGWEE